VVCTPMHKREKPSVEGSTESSLVNEYFKDDDGLRERE